MAPGEDIPATGYFDEIIKTDGTSMAAPHVTGAASVLWAKDRSKSAKFIRALLNASARRMSEDEGSGVVDLNYAISVYDEFASSYVEDMDNPESLIGENNASVQSYDDSEVAASWAWSDHQSAVGLYPDVQQSSMNVIKIGAKIPDTASYLQYSNGTTDSFHGHYNYIANYMYVMRMARICYNSGMTAALSNATYPGSGTGQSQIYNGISALNSHWSTVLSGYTINNANKARVLAGIASHIAMDVYAHKAYTKDSSGNWTVHISGNANQDSTTYVPNRWTCAKDIAYDVVNVWHYSLTPDAMEFYQSSHDKSKFRLYKFKNYCSSADSSTYSSEQTWFKDRTADAN